MGEWSTFEGLIFLVGVVLFVLWDSHQTKKKKALKKERRRKKKERKHFKRAPSPSGKASAKPAPEPEPESPHKNELLMALKSLGFGKSDADMHAQKAMAHSPQASLEDLVRLALASSQNRLE
jgi:Holliday junction resolvasome RuvABC DNA-binding subunit